MAFPNVFQPEVTAALLARLEALRPDSSRQWGSMTPSHMCTHCCFLYDQIEGRATRGPWVLRILGRLFFKQKAVGDQPFARNLPTPKPYQVQDTGDFAGEHARLHGLIARIHGQGAGAFEGRPHPSFGPLTAEEWSNLMWKHLDHHLRQFGL
jgi:hypothetical protein